MAYNRKTWKPGDVISSVGLNNIEDGIATNDARITNLNIPTKTSQLTNDSGFATTAQFNQVAFTGDYQDLINTPTNVTTMGNEFNSANQLVQLDAQGRLPAIDGSQLTGISSGESYELPIASTTTLGGVKIGNGLSIDDTGILSVTSGPEGTTDYNDLINKPSINNVTLTGNQTTESLGLASSSELENIKSTLTQKVNYTDLTNYYTKKEADAEFATKDELNTKVDATELSDVATSGSYNDLTNKPTINNVTLSGNIALSQLSIASTSDLETKQDKLTAGTNITIVDNVISATTGQEYTLPIASSDTLGGIKIGTGLSIDDDGVVTVTSGPSGTTDYTQLTNKPQINSIELTGNKSLSDLGIQPAGNYLTEIPDEYVTTTELDSTLSAYAKISDVPTELSELNNDSGFITKDVNDLTNYTLSSSLSTVATTGSYNDLTNKPDIPEPYTLPVATNQTLGGVKVDGTTITITEDGTISSNQSSTSGVQADGDNTWTGTNLYPEQSNISFAYSDLDDAQSGYKGTLSGPTLHYENPSIPSSSAIEFINNWEKWKNGMLEDFGTSTITMATYNPYVIDSRNYLTNCVLGYQQLPETTSDNKLLFHAGTTVKIPSGYYSGTDYTPSSNTVTLSSDLTLDQGRYSGYEYTQYIKSDGTLFQHYYQYIEVFDRDLIPTTGDYYAYVYNENKVLLSRDGSISEANMFAISKTYFDGTNFYFDYLMPAMSPNNFSLATFTRKPST